MSKTGEVPYSWEEIEAQVKDAIRCQASILETFGPCYKDCNIVMDFLGLPRELYTDHDFSLEDLPEIDLRKHVIYGLAEHAYRYAYQLDGWWECSTEAWHEVDGLLQGYPGADANGEHSPFSTLYDFPLRRMFETFFARYRLFESDAPGLDLNIRELALLANMTVPAVRTSLSKEGFKLERVHGKSTDRPDDKSFRLKDEDARLWLSRRRGFIPQRPRPAGEAVQETAEKLLADETVPFHTRLAQAVNLLGYDATTFAISADVDPQWLQGLLGGEHVSPDIDALCVMAKVLGAPLPAFAGAGVRHLLSLEVSDISEGAK